VPISTPEHYAPASSADAEKPQGMTSYLILLLLLLLGPMDLRAQEHVWEKEAGTSTYLHKFAT